MKRNIFTLFLIFICSSIFASELSDTPPDEIFIYKGKEYVKRYEYVRDFNNYGSTIYLKSDIDRVDSLYKIINSQERERKGDENIAFPNKAFVSIQNYAEILSYIKLSFKAKEFAMLKIADVPITKTEKRNMLFRLRVISDSNKNTEHLNITFIGDNSKLQTKIIRLQDELKKIVKLYYDESSAKRRNRDLNKYDYYKCDWILGYDYIVE